MRRGVVVVVLGMGCATPPTATLPTATLPTATLPTATLPTMQQPPTMVTTPSMPPPTPSNRSAPSWWHVNVHVVTPTGGAAMVPRHGEIDVSQWKLEPMVVEQGAIRTIGWGNTHAKWARFLGALHAKVHPLFSDIYLRSLVAPEGPAGVGARPRSVELWWRLTRDGVAKQIAIVEPSGDPEFDIAAIQSLLAALPIRVPAELADAIESTAFRWRFSSQPEVACTTYFANVFEAPALAEP